MRDWFSGDLPSRHVLNLIDGLPDESLFKTWARRGGDWSQQQYYQARLINEVALSRADGKGYMPDLLRSPAQIAEEILTAEYRSRRHSETLQELKGGA